MEENQILDNLSEFQPDEEMNIEPVDTGTRFVNYIIDRIILYILSSVLLLVSDSDDRILNFLLGLVVALIYFTILEGSTNGKTIGKFLTGTRAIRNDGYDVTFNEALTRSLSRIVPFEPISFLFSSDNRGWHDQWTDTSVIKEADYQKIKRQF